MRSALAREELDALLQLPVEAELLGAERETAVLQPLEVEQHVDQRRQPLDLLVDRLQVSPAPVGIELLVEEDLGEPEDPGQRRAQLVGDGRDQILARAFGRPLGRHLAQHEDATDDRSEGVAHGRGVALQDPAGPHQLELVLGHQLRIVEQGLDLAFEAVGVGRLLRKLTQL